MDDLEKELLKYNDMGSSINKIKNENQDNENKDLFRDLDTFSSEKKLNKTPKVDNKIFNVNTFVKELENNLDNLDNSDENIEPFASNQDFNKIKEDFTEKIINFEDEDSNESKYKKNDENWNNKIYNFLINIKEPLIIILLFILLNNNDFIELTYKLPFIKNINSHYPSLIIRAIILVSIIYYLRKL